MFHNFFPLFNHLVLPYLLPTHPIKTVIIQMDDLEYGRGRFKTLVGRGTSEDDEGKGSGGRRGRCGDDDTTVE